MPDTELNNLFGAFMNTDVSIDIDIYKNNSSSGDTDTSTAESVDTNDSTEEQDMKQEAEDAQQAVENNEGSDEAQQIADDATDAEMIFDRFTDLHYAKDHLLKYGVSREWVRMFAMRDHWNQLLGLASFEAPIVSDPNDDATVNMLNMINAHLENEPEFLHQVALTNLEYLEKITDYVMNRVEQNNQKWDALDTHFLRNSESHPIKTTGYNLQALDNRYRDILNAHYTLQHELGLSDLVPAQENFALKIAQLALKPAMWMQKKILNAKFRMKGGKPYLVNLTYFAEPTSKPDAFKKDSWKLVAVVLTYMVDIDKFETAKVIKGLEGLEGTRTRGTFDDNFINKVSFSIGCSKFTAKAAMIQSMKVASSAKKLEKIKEATPQLLGYFKGQNAFPDDLAKEVKHGKEGNESFTLHNNRPVSKLIAGVCSMDYEASHVHQYGDPKQSLEIPLITWRNRALNMWNDVFKYSDLVTQLKAYAEINPTSLINHRESLYNINKAIPTIAETFLLQLSLLNKTYNTLHHILTK